MDLYPRFDKRSLENNLDQLFARRHLEPSSRNNAGGPHNGHPNDQRQNNYVQGKGFKAYYYQPSNPPIGSLLNSQSSRDYGGYNQTSNYNSNRYEDQFKNHSMFAGNVGNFGTFSKNGRDFPTGYEQFPNIARNKNITPGNSFEIHDNLSSSKMQSKNFRGFEDDRRQEVREPRKSLRNYDDDRRMDLDRGNNSRNTNQIESLDDGFVCVKNPEYFPGLNRRDRPNSMERRNEREQRYRNSSRNERRHSRERSPYRRSRSQQSRSLSRENKNQGHRNMATNERSRQTYRRHSRDNPYQGNYVVNKMHQTEREILDIEDNNIFVNASNTSYQDFERHNARSRTSRDTTRKNLSNPRMENRKITEIDEVKKERSMSSTNENFDTIPTASNEAENQNATIASKQIRRQRTRNFQKHLKERKKKFVELRRRNAIKIKEKKKELKQAGIIGRPAKGHIKCNPEEYWKSWWVKYAYIEDIIDEVDANDVSVTNFIKFRYDITDPDLDAHVSEVYRMGFAKIKSLSSIDEINYERRLDAFKILKYKKIVENKDFQSYTLPGETRSLRTALHNLNKRKERLALLYQSVIHRWHVSKRLIDSEEIGTRDQLSYAKYLFGLQLFHYLVLDSIQELKKLTAEDWPEFLEFYNNLK